MTSLILACTLLSTAPACPNLVPEFSAKASDGKTYTPASFITKPTIIVFIKNGCPSNPEQFPNLARLQKELGQSAQIVGFINANQADTFASAKTLKTKLPLIPDPNNTVIKGFGATRSFDLCVVATKEEARWAKVWEGFSQSHVSEILDLVKKHGQPVPTLKLDYLPKTPFRGCGL